MTDHWRNLLVQAVSPLRSGVRDLEIKGMPPPGMLGRRPSRTAAVLVPLLEMPDPEIVLTRRADHLPQHPGQVSFPGGAVEEGDESAVQTALREAYEEIGLPPELTTPIGFLDRMDTISDYRVLPVVALVTPPVQWIVDEREVAEVFTVPFSVALDQERYVVRQIQRDGQAHTIWSLEWQGFNVWGATAAIIINLSNRLRAANEV